MAASEVFRRAMILKLIVLCLFNSFYCVRSQLDKHVGSACIGKDNVTGTCLNLYKCPSAVVTYLYALLGYGEDSNAAQWLCGGTVISPNYILTAAHCSSAPLLGPVTFAATGILKRTDPIDQWQINAIAEIIAHPEYKSPSKYHDIALLRVEGLIRFSKDVLPACVQTLNYTYGSVQGVGWGRLGHRNALADTLQVIDLIKFEDDKCGQLFPPHRHMKNGFDPATQTCYGNPYMIVDTCEGDSGGPIHIEYHNCQYTVTGVTSFGKDCGLKGGAGIYTRVQYYVPWIESVVWPNVKEPYDTGF